MKYKGRPTSKNVIDRSTPMKLQNTPNRKQYDPPGTYTLPEKVRIKIVEGIKTNIAKSLGKQDTTKYSPKYSYSPSKLDAGNNIKYKKYRQRERYGN